MNALQVYIYFLEVQFCFQHCLQIICKENTNICYSPTRLTTVCWNYGGIAGLCVYFRYREEKDRNQRKWKWVRSEWQYYALCVNHFYCGMYIPLSDDKHQMVRENSKVHWMSEKIGQRGRNSNLVATSPHAAVVFRMQLFIYI